jgi:hypothetical protein
MDSVADNAPSIIEAAAQSTLGILALLILTVGVIAYLFFGKSSDRVKVVIFSMIFVGMAGFGLVILGQASAEPQRADPGPPGPVVDDGGGGGSDDPGPEPNGPDDPPDEPERPPADDRTEITLTYAGDPYGCELDLTIGIGDQTYRPQSNVFQATGLRDGRQPYVVEGGIACPGVGMCDVYGGGTLDVAPNAVYGLSWQNTDYATCEAVLHRQ